MTGGGKYRGGDKLQETHQLVDRRKTFSLEAYFYQSISYLNYAFLRTVQVFICLLFFLFVFLARGLMLKDIFGSFVKITQRVDRDYYGDLLAQIAVKIGAQKKNAHREAHRLFKILHMSRLEA